MAPTADWRIAVSEMFERDKLLRCVWPLDGSLVSVVSPEGENVSGCEFLSVIDVQESLHA